MLFTVIFAVCSETNNFSIVQVGFALQGNHACLMLVNHEFPRKAERIGRVTCPEMREVFGREMTTSWACCLYCLFCLFCFASCFCFRFFCFVLFCFLFFFFWWFLQPPVCGASTLTAHAHYSFINQAQATIHTPSHQEHNQPANQPKQQQTHDGFIHSNGV